MKWGIWGEENLQGHGKPFWISEFIDSDVDRLKVQLCTQLRTPNNAAVAKVLLEAFSAYEVPQIWCSWDIDVCWYKMDHDTHERCGGYCTKSFLVQDSKNSMRIWQGKPVVQILKLCYWVIPFHSTWQCLGFQTWFGDVWATLRVEDAKDFTVTALTFWAVAHQSDTCVCDKMWMWVGWFYRAHSEHCTLSSVLLRVGMVSKFRQPGFGFVDLCVCSFCFAAVC